MRLTRPFRHASRTIIGATMVALLGASAITLPRGGAPPRGYGVPATLRDNEYFIGQPWNGGAGVTETVRDIMARARSESAIWDGQVRLRRLVENENGERASNPQKPDSPRGAEWP